MGFNTDTSLLLEAIDEIIYEAAVTKKRVFTKAKLIISSDSNVKLPTCIYLTLSAEPPIFGSSIYIGDDLLVDKTDMFTTSVIEQSKQLEGLNEQGTIQ